MATYETEEERRRREEQERAQREAIEQSGFTPEENERVYGGQTQADAPALMFNDEPVKIGKQAAQAQTPAAQPGLTTLNQQEEAQFRDWYTTYASSHGVDPNPDDPNHHYDYRGWWKNANEADRIAKGNDGEAHLEDTYKLPGHETFSDESIYHDPSNPATTGGHWNADGTFTKPSQQIPGAAPKVNTTVPRAARLADMPTMQPTQEITDDMSDSDKLRTAYNNYATETANTVARQNFNNQVALNRYLDKTDAALEQERLEQEKTRKDWRRILQENQTAQQALIKEAEAQTERERQAAIDEYQADQRAAKWTGLTELAASIANMVGVGSFNASNQTYKSYSQDWMKQADADLKARRSRIESLRDRQNTLKQQLNTLKLEGGQKEIALRREDAKDNRAAATARAEAEYKGALAANELASKARQSASELAAKGEVAGTQADIDYGTLRYRYSNRGGGNNNRNSGSNQPLYEVTVDGQSYMIPLSETSYKRALAGGKDYIKQDIEAAMNEALKQYPEQDDDAKRRDRKQRDRERDNIKAEYDAVLSALNGTGDAKEDDAVIEAFVQRHGRELNQFNKYVLRLSGQSLGGSNRSGNGLDDYE